jgi:hypothetical protein
LQGGFNNYVNSQTSYWKRMLNTKLLSYINKGIVTKFVLKLYPQTDVWVGLFP